MNCARLPLSFCVDPDTKFDTLEMVLAIARRIGLHLARLELEADQVFIDLHAGEPDPLALFHARLNNVIGVYDVCMLPNEQKCRTLRQSLDAQPEKTPCT